jgi:hypothetical protein
MTSNDTRFYTYIYLNPLKRGKFEYNNINICFLYEPFYVGKGCNSRISSHLRESRRILNGTSEFKSDTNRHKIYTICKIWENGVEPIILKIDKDMTNDDALALEIKLIGEIGRTDLNTGSLVNHTNGGDTGGMSPTQLLKHSERMTGENNPFYGKNHTVDTISFLKDLNTTEDTKKKMRDSWDYDKHFTAETKQKMSNSHKGTILSDATREKLRIVNTGRIHTEETKRKISAKILGNTHKDEVKQQISQTIKDNYEQLRNEVGIPAPEKKINTPKPVNEKQVDVTHFNYGSVKSAEARKKMSDAKKGLYAGDNHPCATTYILKSPCGEQYTVTGKLRVFCDEYMLTYNAMYIHMNAGIIPPPLPRKCFMTERRINTTGWSIEKIN